MVCVAALSTSLLCVGQVTRARQVPSAAAPPGAPAPAPASAPAAAPVQAPAPAPAQAPAAAQPAGPGAAAAPANGNTPVQRADATPKGELRNPYSDTDAAVVQAGNQLYLRYGCNGCHGGNGGGGMCPPLTNDVWVYGGDDDTLFRLVAYGTETLQTKGYSRKGTENVVGPMPPMGQIVQTDDELWRILAFVRSNYHGAPECKLGCPSE